MSSSQKLVLVIGGTGAQGVPVVKALATDGKYAVRVLTRTATSEEAQDLASISGVEIFEGDAYSEPSLRKAFNGVTHVFANTNGFAIGEKAEIYWGIRLYELSREFQVEHFLWAGLEYATQLGNFDKKYRTGHLDGKAKVTEYLKAQPKTPMGWSVLTSCLYAEGLGEILRPLKENDTFVFSAPLGDARCPLIHLEDYGRYARWIFDTPSRSYGLNLHVATEDIAWKELVAAFTEVTGKKAIYRDVTLDEYFQLGILSDPEAIIGAATAGDDNTLFTIRENFSGFWNTWRDELTKRDYSLLDEILPSRVKSIKEWMIKTGYTGEPKSVLKDYRDGARGAASS